MVRCRVNRVEGERGFRGWVAFVFVVELWVFNCCVTLKFARLDCEIFYLEKWTKQFCFFVRFYFDL